MINTSANVFGTIESQRQQRTKLEDEKNIKISKQELVAEEHDIGDHINNQTTINMTSYCCI